MNPSMRGALGVLLLLVVGVCIVGPALDPTFELPAQHFDGDADDSGQVGEVFTWWVDPAVTETLTVVVSANPVRHPPAHRNPQAAAAPPNPLGSRAPPA